MKKFLCLSTAALCLSACLVSCGNKKEDTKNDTSSNTSTSDSAKKETNEFVGKWQCKEIEMNGEKSDNFLGADAFTLFQLDVQDGGKGSVTSVLLSLFSDEITAFDINWEKSGDDAIRINVIEPETETTTSDSDMTFENEPETFLLKKIGSDYIIVAEEDEEDEEEDDSKIYLEKVDEFTPIPEDFKMSLNASFGMDEDLDIDATTAPAETTQKAE